MTTDGWGEERNGKGGRETKALCLPMQKPRLARTGISAQRKVERSLEADGIAGRGGQRRDGREKGNTEADEATS